VAKICCNTSDGCIRVNVAINFSKRQGEGTFVNDLKPSVYLNSLIPMITLDKDNY
jgi:hypothetical protein